MIGSQRIKRIVTLRERMRDAERTSQALAERAFTDAELEGTRAAAWASEATRALGTTCESGPDALELLAQAAREAAERELRASEELRLRARDLERQRLVRLAAERDVKLAVLAYDRASDEEAVEADKRFARASDDRTASVWRQR
jgi:hypothetical protein